MQPTMMWILNAMLDTSGLKDPIMGIKTSSKIIGAVTVKRITLGLTIAKNNNYGPYYGFGNVAC